VVPKGVDWLTPEYENETTPMGSEDVLEVTAIVFWPEAGASRV
jgi:hypothetical protein